jgi:helix-turn-helix protein
LTAGIVAVRPIQDTKLAHTVRLTPDRHERPRNNKELRLRIGQHFNPYKLFTGIFIPEALVRYRGLTCGAKIAYGRLARYAGEKGECFPSIPTLATETGIGATQARAYVHELSAKRFIAIEARPGTSGVYKFLWHEAFAGEIGNKRKAPPLRKTGGVPLRKTGPPPLRKTGDEENHHQDSQVKESQAPTKAAIIRKAENQNLLVSPSDDDEKHREAPVRCSPWEELRRAYRAASRGADMTFQDECWLKEQIELRHISPDALDKLVRENPLTGFHSPMAGLKWLVKKFRTKTRSAVELATGASIAFSSPVETSRCEKCSNTGRILEPVEGELRPRATDQYCDCRMGKEIEAVERRSHKTTALLDGHTFQGRPSWGSGAAGRETGDQHAAN